MMVEEGVIYLNEILDENTELHPLEQQKQVSKDYRQIGLGIMGLADLFIKMGIEYGSEESIELIHEIGYTLADTAIHQSALLAKEDGAFPKMNLDAILSSPYFIANTTDETKELVRKYGVRNSQLLTIAPTGSISTLAGCSNGVEPIFQVSYNRKTESLHNEDKYYTVFTQIIKELMEHKGITDEKDLPDYIVTTSNLDYRKRIDVQSAWQQYIDASISSTVNVPNEFTVEEVEDLYMYAWEQGIKGVTIYRDGCARTGILTTDDTKDTSSDIQGKMNELNQFTMLALLDDPELYDRVQKKRRELGIDEAINTQLEKNPDVCPMCEGQLIHSGGCDECQDCGYSPCSI